MEQEKIWRINILKNIKNIVIAALFIAILTIFTMLISIPIGIYGYINLSDFLILLISSIFPMGFSIIVAGIGTALADILLGFSQYAIITFFAKSIEAFIAYYLFQKMKMNKILVYPLATLAMIVIYGLGDVILSLNPFIFLSSLIANLPQAIICSILAILSINTFKKIMERISYGSE